MVRHASLVVRWGAVGTAGIALAACASTLSIPRAHGTISGTTAGCSTTRHPRPVTVVVLEDATIRTSVTVRPGARFEFHLSPGHYVVSTGARFSRVTLGAGDHATVVFPSTCPRRSR